MKANKPKGFIQRIAAVKGKRQRGDSPPVGKRYVQGDPMKTTKGIVKNAWRRA